MENYICQIFTPRVSSRFLGKMSASTDGIHAGQVFVADELDGDIAGNISVYRDKMATIDSLGSKFFAVVLNDGFETLDDGRRPSGNPNYYTYTYKKGDVMPIAFWGKNLKFNIGLDSVNPNTKTLATVGNYLIPNANSKMLSASATIPTGTKVALQIISLYNTPIGGQFGGGMAVSLICTPIIDESVAVAVEEGGE